MMTEKKSQKKSKKIPILMHKLVDLIEYSSNDYNSKPQKEKIYKMSKMTSWGAKVKNIDLMHDGSRNRWVVAQPYDKVNSRYRY